MAKPLKYSFYTNDSIILETINMQIQLFIIECIAMAIAISTYQGYI